jgi:hypothetical protein
VHAFTDLGMTGQLVLYVLTFIFITVLLLINDKLFRGVELYDVELFDAELTEIKKQIALKG